MAELANEQYDLVYRKGRLKYFGHLARGESGHLLSMERQFPDMEVTFEEDLGLESVLLRKIIGTWSSSRATMFTDNFLPLAAPDKSEFSIKWVELYQSHLNEGIRDPVKLYEYLNWYYVIEGNKRVSVLNSVGAHSIEAHVIRLLPRKEPMTREKQTYFDFIDFKKETGISEIWLNRAGGFSAIGEYIDDADHFLKKIYRPFRKLFHSLGGNKKLSLTTGEALLRFLEIFQKPDSFLGLENKKNLTGLMEELILEESNSRLNLDTDVVENLGKQNPIYSMMTSGKKPLKVAFLYAKPLAYSGWSYAHEQGRLFVQDVLGDKVDTFCITDVPENEKAFDTMKDLVDIGTDVIFSTSPFFTNAALKASIQFPKVLFYTCTSGKSHKRMRTYFGQSFESSYLTGILAALTDREGLIGYIATENSLERFSRINGFLRGARLINPECKVKLKLSHYWDYPEYSRKLARNVLENDCNLIFQHSLPKPGNRTGEYGLYNFSYDDSGEIVNHYGATVWNWGQFYLSLVRNRLSGSKGDFRSSDRSMKYNFWGGLRANVIDLIVNHELVPPETRFLISRIKEDIISKRIHPFYGPLYDNHGKLRIKKGETADLDDIRGMDWLCEGIIEI